MLRFIMGRLLQTIGSLFAITVIIFIMTRLTGDPTALLLSPEAPKEAHEMLRKELLLDQPWPVQYWRFISGAVQGDFGFSYRWRTPALALTMDRLPNTVELALVAMVLAIIVGIPIGVQSAVRKGGFLDGAGKIVALFGQSAPTFWIGIMLILLFAVVLRWLPAAGSGGITNLILPAIALSGYATAAVMRITRSAMLDVLDTEYIKLARAKGVKERTVIWKHGFKNAAIPIVTMIALQFGAFLRGAVTVEVVFAWPGVGRLAADAIFSADFPVVQAVVIVTAALFFLTNLLADVVYAYLDPRIKYA